MNIVDLLKASVLVTLLILLTGCVSSYTRVPPSAFRTDDVLYISCVDRVPREVVDTPPGVRTAVAPIAVIGDIIVAVTPEMISAYKEVERNTILRSTELYVSNYTNKSPEDIKRIIEALHATVTRSVPSK